MIVDPVEQVVISIEHNSRTVTISHGSKPVAPADSGTKSTAMTNVKPVREKTRLPGSEPLGTMTLEGLVAVGTRYTRGIDRTESWVSDDLPGTLLMMKSEGPQPGTVITMKLVNIKREEPDPQLFRPPADYTVRETGISVSSGNHR